MPDAARVAARSCGTAICATDASQRDGINRGANSTINSALAERGARRRTRVALERTAPIRSHGGLRHGCLRSARTEGDDGMRDARGSQGGWSPAARRERLAGARAAALILGWMAHARRAFAFGSLTRTQLLLPVDDAFATRTRPSPLEGVALHVYPPPLVAPTLTPPLRARASGRPPSPVRAARQAGAMVVPGGPSPGADVAGWAQSRRRCGGEGALIGCMHEVGRKAAGGAAAVALPRSLHVVLL